MEEEPIYFTMVDKNAIPDSSTTNKRGSLFNRSAYLQEKRRDKIERYLAKKKRRVWMPKISYNCRKVVADKRERKNGRFVKKEEILPARSSAKSSKETGEVECKE